jgi:uncharacterized RDD family membrane protein YckC
MSSDDVALPVAAPDAPPAPPADEDAARVERQLAAWRLRTARREPEVRYAGFAVRALAFLIDGLVLTGFGIPLVAAGVMGVRAGVTVLAIPAPPGVEDALARLATGAWLAMAFVYFTALHRGGGQTIGKAVVGVRVCTLALDPVGTLRSLFRTLCYLASSSFGGIGFLLAAITPRKRAWHDLLAGTCVVHRAREES